MVTALLGCHGSMPGGSGDALPDATNPFASGWGAPAIVTLDRPTGMFATDASFVEDQSRVTYAVTALGSSDYDIYEAPMLSSTMGGTRKIVLARPGTVERSPEISPDGLALYLLAFPGATGEIERMTRPSLMRPWDTPSAPAELNAGSENRPGNIERTRTHVVIARGPALVELATDTSGTFVEQPTTSALPASARDPQLTADGLALVFTASDGASSADIYVATRPAIDMPWSEGARIDVSDPEMAESNPWLATDGKRLYFSRGATVYMSQR